MAEPTVIISASGIKAAATRAIARQAFQRMSRIMSWGSSQAAAMSTASFIGSRAASSVRRKSSASACRTPSESFSKGKTMVWMSVCQTTSPLC